MVAESKGKENVLDRGRESPSEEGLFEQGLAQMRNEEKQLEWDKRGQSIPGGRNSKCKSPGAGFSLPWVGNSKEASGLEPSEPEESRIDELRERTWGPIR